MVLKSCNLHPAPRSLHLPPPPTDCPPPASRISGQAGPWHEGGRAPGPRLPAPPPLLQVTDKPSAHLPHQAGGHYT